MLNDVAQYLTEQPESPQEKTGSDNYTKTRVRIYKFDSPYFDIVSAAIEANDPGLDDDGYLQNYSINKQGYFSLLTCHFSNRLSTSNPNVNITCNKPLYYLEWQENNIPLEQLTSNYRTKWNHVLAQKKGSTKSATAYSTATDTIIPDADADDFHWYKSTSQVPEGWRVVIKKIKPGVEEKYNKNAVVREEVWTRTEKAAENFATRKTYKKTPADTCGVTGGEWLVEPSMISPEGNLFRVTTLYQNAYKWDDDLYS